MSEGGKLVAFLMIAMVTCNHDLENKSSKHHRVRRALTFQNGTRILVS